MLAAFSEIMPLLGEAVATEPGVGALVERMQIGFQYQDRISQMLALLHADMVRLQAASTDLPDSVDTLSSDAWLAALAARFVTVKQGHDANPETTFFQKDCHGNHNIGH